MSKVDYKKNRQYVEDNMKTHNMTLAEAVVDFCDTHEVPYDKLRQYFDHGMINKIKAALAPLRKGHVERLQMFLGFIKG
jgi:tRNA splicing ligase